MMLSRTKCLSIALVLGIVGQSFGLSRPATASAPSTISSRPAAISPLSSPLGAPETLTPTATVSDTVSVPDATSTITESIAASPSVKTSHIDVQVDFDSKTVRNGQTVHGSLRAQWQGVKQADLAPSAPFTVEVVLPTGLEYVEGSSSGQYDPAQRRLSWDKVQLDGNGQAVLPFAAMISSTDAPQRLALQPSAVSTQAVRVTPQRSQLRVMQAAPAQKVSAKTGGTFQTASGHVRLDFSQDSFPGASIVITGDEGPLVAPSEIMPDAQPKAWKALANAARQQSFNADADQEQALDEDITRLSLADPLLKVDFYPSMIFSRPVTATFDLGTQIAQELAASGLTPVLQYAIETPFTSTYQVSPTLSIIITNTRRTFEELPSWYDPDTGRLTAFIGHFSTYEVNVSDLPKPWRLAPSLGEIDPLRGSYGYQYPIQVPAMQDGLAPQLDLRYSSSKGDADSTIEPFGHGWSIEIPKVMRKLRQTAEVTTISYPVEQGPDNGNCPHPVNNGWCWYVVGSYSTVSGYHLDYEDKFTLSFGGQDHYLVQKSTGSNEYVTLNYTPLRIYRCSNTLSCGSNAVSNSNASTEYWQVWIPDGVRYVFGTDTASEVRLNGTSPAATVTQAWYLKSVFAPYRDDPAPAVNRASVQYFYTQKTDAGGAYQTNLTRVEYGNRLRPDGTTVGAQYSVTLQYVDRTTRLSQPLTITVREEGNVTRQYQFGYDGHSGSDGNEAQNLSRIQEIAPNGATLPAVTFTYIYTQSRAFISQMSNGYGASAQLSYYFARGGFRMQTSQHTDTATNWKDYNYYIYYDEAITDTEHPTGYSPCFDWLVNDAFTGEPLCRVDGYDYSVYGTYRLLGYPVVEVQSRNPANPAEWLGVTKHYYKFETWRLGQEFRVRQEGGVSAIASAPSEPPLAESWVTQTKQLTTGMPMATGVMFGAASEKVEIPDVNHPERYKRTTYAYDPVAQGGTQYGQTTGVWEYDAANPGATLRLQLRHEYGDLDIGQDGGAAI